MATATTTYTVIVLENCRVSPPAAAVVDTSLPLTFFDIIWLMFHPMSRVLFYDFPCSTTKFTHTVVPSLKNSLSLALKHFFPLAGNLITPPNISITNPQIRYLDGDSVTLIFAECTSADFNHLSGNHARDADELFPLVPRLPEGACNNVSGEDCVAAPLFAVQVTLFPDRGISIGFTNSHVVADGSTMFNFVRAWASFAKQQLLLLHSSRDDNHDDAPSSFQLPFYDRDVIKDPKGLSAIYRTITGGLIEHQRRLQQGNSQEAQHPPAASIKKVRATFFMRRPDIQALKDLVLTKLPTLAHVSSLTVVCAYLWTCMAKMRAAIGEGVQDEDEPQHLGVSIDCRARLNPPIPAAYFGNCLLPGVSHGKSTQLVGEGGFFMAAELIGEAIHKKVHNKEEDGGVLKGAEVLFAELEGSIKGEWGMGVAGSPSLDYYNTIDFGLGKLPKKFEFVSEPLSLSRSKDSEGGGDMEIGLCLPKNEMDVFPTIFAKGIRDLLHV